MVGLTAEFTANTAGLDKGIDRAQSRLRGFGRQVGQISKRMAQLGAAVTAAGTAMTTVLVRNSLESIDAMSKLARQLGTTTQSMGVMARAAELSGASFRDLERSTVRMNAILGEAARGAGTGVVALEKLNLTAEQLIALPLDQRLALVAQRMQEMNLTAAEQADILNKLGDSRGRLFNILEQGAGVLQRARVEAEAFGLAVSDVDARQIERANDALSTLGAVVRGLGNRIAVFLAPFLEKIGDDFAAAAVESRGFEDEVRGAFEVAARMGAQVADVIRYIQVGLAALNVGVNAVGDVFIQAFAGAEAGLRAFWDFQIESANTFIQLLNKIPGFDIGEIQTPSQRGIGQGIQRFAAESTKLVADSRLALNQLLSEPLPSDSIEAWLADVERAAVAAKDTVIAERQEQIAAAAALDQAAREREAEAEAVDQEKVAAEFEAFRQNLLDEEQAEIESHLRRLEELRKFHEQGFLTDQEAAAAREQLAAEHEGRMVEIRKRGMTDLERFNAKSWRDQTATVVGELSRMTSAVAQQNKVLFSINKAAAIAEAVIQGALGVARTLGAYPFPLNIAMAAAHAAVAAAQVQAIASQQFTGGNSNANVAPAIAATAAPAVTPVGGGQGGGGDGTTANITLQGDVFSRESVVGLIDQINDAVGDGAQLRVS